MLPLGGTTAATSETSWRDFGGLRRGSICNGSEPRVNVSMTVAGQEGPLDRVRGQVGIR
jgi:hypothetical protein